MNLRRAFILRLARSRLLCIRLCATKRNGMEEIKRRIDELAKMVAERGGACIIYVNPGNGEGTQLVNEGYMKDLAMLVGTAMLADDDMKEYIMRGVEAAQYAENKKKEKNDKADC